MQWRRTEPVQAVAALLTVGPDAPARLSRAMEDKPSLFHRLKVEHGEGWAVIFAEAVETAPGQETLILPRLEDAAALYLAWTGWWLPVGMALAAPDHAHGALWQAMAVAHDIVPPAVVAPRFADGAALSGEADVYLTPTPTPFHSSTLAPGRRVGAA